MQANARDPGATLETLAFLQYTSGSTATPRGVMVTHGNLLHNLACLREVFQFSPESIGVTWLPHYHDMGLIGGLLQPVYAGGEMIVMPPSSFLQRPIRWLAAVTRYRATTMVAPNFAYELCVQKISAEQRASLDLASVKVALCGAEPVRPDTLAQFAKAFGPCGFRQEAFRPAYGLAEATLIVSGHSDGGAPFTPAVLAEELQRNRIQPAEEGAAGSRVLVGCGGIAPGPQRRDCRSRNSCALRFGPRGRNLGFGSERGARLLAQAGGDRARHSARIWPPAKAPSFAPAISDFSIAGNSSSPDV